MKSSHSLQALGRGGLPKPGKDLTSQVGLQTVDTRTVFDQGNPVIVLGRLLIGCLVSSILWGLGMMAALVLLS